MSAEPMDDCPTITIGQLRQNPTQMIRDVRQGAEYILTDRGVPTAKIIPLRRHRWVPADQVRDGASEPDRPEWVTKWIAEVEAARDQDMIDDPWDRDPWPPREPRA